MTIKALIPVRSGSQRVKNKNIAPFAGTNLLKIKIKQLLRIPELDGVVVNSNSDEMLEIARSLGAETVKRDEYFATSSVAISEVYENMAQNMDCDTILFADATNPLLKDETIHRAINLYNNFQDEYDSVMTATPVKLFMYYEGKPINYTEDKKPRSQDLPNILALNSALHILPRILMEKKKSIVGYKPYLLPIDRVEATDIDDQIDFDFAEFMYKKEQDNAN